MHFICRSFSGNSESTSWSRYWENNPDDSFLKSTKGHLFVLIDINSQEEKDLSSIGHDINFEFNQNYFNTENNLSIIDNLQQSIKSIVQNPLYSNYQIDFSAIVVLNDKVYLASFGNTKIVLKRQNKISILLNNFENQVETLIGNIENNDRFFLLTNSFFEKITWQKIKLFLSDDKIQNIEENFLSAIFSLKDQNKLAAALIEIESDEDDFVENQIPDFPKPNFDFSKISSVFVPHHESRQVTKRKRIGLLFGILLLTVLFITIFFGVQNNKKQSTEKKYQELKTEIETKIDNINKTKSLSLDSAREAAVNAKEIVNKMSALKIHEDEINNFNSQLENILSQTGSSDTYTPSLFYETNKIVDNPQFQKIIFNDNKIYLLDSTNGRIDYLDTDSKSSKLFLSSEKIKSALNFAFDTTNLYLFDEENISLVSKTDVTVKISLADVKAADFKFWNGSAYVLDSENQTVWKFTPNSSGFSKAQNWLKNDAKLKENVISLSINGKIWVLYQNGTVVPYLSGVKEDFTPSQTSNFTKTDKLDVTQEKDFLAFVDNENIIYLYQKSGELLKKFNFNNLKINDIAFDESNNIIYVLCSDNNIYSVKY